MHFPPELQIFDFYKTKIYKDWCNTFWNLEISEREIEMPTVEDELNLRIKDTHLRWTPPI